jgi:hypothetical protein
MNPEDFRDKNRKYFFTGDVEEISKMLESINSYIPKLYTS